MIVRGGRRHFADIHDSLRLFQASRALLDPSDCHDIVSLKSLICMAYYTQSCSMTTTCHSYVCIAVATALHIGIFDKSAEQKPNEAVDNSSAVAAVLFIMDTCITTALGLPRLLRDVEIDLIVPESSMSLDLRSPLVGTACAVHLARLLAQIVESNYPSLRVRPQTDKTYVVKCSDIEESERQLSLWFTQMKHHSVTFADNELLGNADFIR